MVFAHLIIRLHIVQHQGLLVMDYVLLQTHQAIVQRRDQLDMDIAQVPILHRIARQLDLLLMECALLKVHQATVETKSLAKLTNCKQNN